MLQYVEGLLSWHGTVQQFCVRLFGNIFFFLSIVLNHNPCSSFEWEKGEQSQNNVKVQIPLRATRVRENMDRIAGSIEHQNLKKCKGVKCEV